MWPTRGIHAGLVGPFRRRRHLPADLCIDVATAASGAERRMYCLSLPTICSIALCSLAPARRPKTAVGKGCGHYRCWPDGAIWGHRPVGTIIFNRTINVRVVSFCFVPSLLGC